MVMALPSQSVPPKISGSGILPERPVPPGFATKTGPALFATVTLLFAAIGGAAVLFFFDPSRHHFYPVCQFHQITGLYCPGCGATRASYQLLHGNFLAALRDNALYVATLAALAARGAWVLKRKACHQPVRYFVSPEFLWSYLAVALVFAILRNLPPFSFLAPQ